MADGMLVVVGVIGKSPCGDSNRVKLLSRGLDGAGVY